MLLEKRGFFDGVRGVKIFYRYWEPRQPRGAVVLLHGLGLNSGFYYKKLAERLAERGLAAYAMDYRGHGFSQGTRGHVDQFEDFLKDIEQLLDIAAKKNSNIYLIGENLGGLLALGAAEFNPDKVKGVIALVPALAPRAKVPKMKLLLGKNLSKIAPTMNILESFGPEQFLKKSPHLDAESKSQLVDTFTVSFAVEVFEGTQNVINRFTLLEAPVYFLLGGRDEIMDTPRTLKIIEPIRNKEVKVYDDLSHFLLLEAFDRVAADIEAWLEKRLPAPEEMEEGEEG